MLTSTPRQPDNRLLWQALSELVDVELHYVTREEQRHLGRYLRRFDLSSYDRIILDLLFRHVSRHVRLLSQVPGLVFYEEDACQEFIRDSRWYRKFSAFYRMVPHARVIFTGFRVAEQFKSMGIDASFLPKGYDSSKLYDMHGVRDIPLGFIGRLGSDAYRNRREFLGWAAARFGVQILRAEPGDDYRNTLNRIKIFVSADIGLGEYMAKNFEAMACGCVLLACRQGGGEEEALGFQHGRQVLLYDDEVQFEQLLQSFQENPQLLGRLAAEGEAHARQRFDYAGQGQELLQILRPAMRPPEKLFSVWLRLRLLLTK